MTTARQGMAIPMFSQHQSRPFRLPVTKGTHMITRERLKELFDYDQEGFLIRKITVNHKSKAGDKVSYLHNTGYVRVTVDQQQIYVHRAIWLWHTGVLPDDDIDHINGCRTDNRIENLRLATRSQNNQNRTKAGTNNKSGFLGVSWNNRDKKWFSRIRIDYKTINCGSFDTPEEAHQAYLAKKRELHPFSTIT
jgi:hypothetical protein